MKTLIFIIAVLFTSKVFSQVTDSTEIKLNEYKNLFDKGLINQDEYEKLKGSLLFPKNDFEKKDIEIKSVDKNAITDLKKEYKGNLIGGSVLLAGGVAAIGGGIHYKNNKIPDLSKYFNKNGIFNSSAYDAALKTYRAKKIIIFSIGGVCAGAGLVLEILGIYNRQVYINKKKDISLSMSNQGIGASITF